MNASWPWLAGTVAPAAVFVLTYVAIAVGKLPGLRLDRAGAALVGATLMIWLGTLTLDEAYRAIDFNTLALLLGMMIVVANLRLSGFFAWINQRVARHATRPLGLLAAIVFSAGVLSAFLVNDAICLMMTPMVLDITVRLKRDPVPYLLALALAANVGSSATLTGNPQNMIIGGISGIAYTDFAISLAPVALVGLALTVVVVALAYRGEFLSAARLQAGGPEEPARPMPLAAPAVSLLVVLLFFSGQPIAKAALLGGALMLLIQRHKIQQVYREIDWPLLLMFAGLFVVVAGFERVALTPQVLAAARHAPLAAPLPLAGLTALLSNMVSNVPAVLVLKPFVSVLPDPARAWRIVAMASTFAGNFTLVGSVANLIVAQRAEHAGVNIGFWRYLRVGAPLTVVTIIVGAWWL